MIRTRMEEVGIRSPGAYLRKMALDGYCVKLEIEDIKEAIFLLRNATNNLNQYAKQANTTGAVYKKDIVGGAAVISFAILFVIMRAEMSLEDFKDFLKSKI